MVTACENKCFSSLFAVGDVRAVEFLRLSDRNPILVTQINVYIINPVVYGVPNIKLSNIKCLLVDFGKVLCSSANELQRNSNASSREDYTGHKY